ncbi:MAG: WXG100 family type VII secretion target [Ruminococcus sp.]|nr:WXG100 family type VII secretion target [Ruminococcus sp.]
MAAFKVTTATLVAQANEITNLNGRFKTATESLVTAEMDLNSMWDGEANTAFHNAFLTDKAKMDEFYNLINEYVARLQMIATRYTQTEQTNVQIATNRTY